MVGRAGRCCRLINTLRPAQPLVSQTNCGWHFGFTDRSEGEQVGDVGRNLHRQPFARGGGPSGGGRKLRPVAAAGSSARWEELCQGRRRLSPVAAAVSGAHGGERSQGGARGGERSRSGRRLRRVGAASIEVECHGSDRSGDKLGGKTRLGDTARVKRCDKTRLGDTAGDQPGEDTRLGNTTNETHTVKHPSSVIQQVPAR